MAEKTQGRTYTVKDLYLEAAKMVKDEMRGIKDQPLTQAEEIKMNEMARLISNTVLKEMKLA